MALVPRLFFLSSGDEHIHQHDIVLFYFFVGSSLILDVECVGRHDYFTGSIKPDIVIQIKKALTRKNGREN